MSDLLKMAVGAGVAACVAAVALPRFLGQGLSAAPASPVATSQRAVAPPPADNRSRANGFGEVVLQPGPGGHYHARVEIQGRALPMLVDTGATVIALTDDDARAIGVHLSPSDYTAPVSTANGVARAARATLREVRIDTIVARDVEALVMPRGALTTSLLGMSFLKKLRGFEIANGKLVLRP